MRVLITILGLIIISRIALPQTNIDSCINNDTILFTSDFFDQTKPLLITLEFDVKRYMQEKPEGYIPAKLKYIIKDSLETEKEIRIKARGESRYRHCYLPPFWLNVKQSNIVDDYLESHKVKVVTLCRSGSVYEDYLFREYLIYKMYNIITDNSFKVRLLKINYVDVGRKNKIENSWAFMIEPEDLLAYRMKALPIKFDNLNYRHTDSLATDIMCLFQYMIGNTDFTVNGRHNVKLLKYKDHTKPNLIPIPYDFDFAGLVNTHYAIPAEILDIKDVTERYYLGMCRSNYEYIKVMEIFESKKDKIYNLVQSFEYLSEKSRRRTIKYLDEFYKKMNKSNFINTELRRTCR